MADPKPTPTGELPPDLAQYAVNPATTGQLPPDLAQYAVQSPTPKGASLDFWDRVKDALRPRKYSEVSGFAPKQKGQPEGLPGVSEGAGLAGGLAEWDKASGGEIAGGVGDILQGDIAKGLHRMLSGTGHALAPTLAVTWPGMIATAGSPALAGLSLGRAATTVASLAGGAVGGAAGHYGAEVLGATPEQANVAGDIGGLLGAGLPTATRFAASKARAMFSALPEDLQQEAAKFAGPRLTSAMRFWKGLEEWRASRKAPLDATAGNVPYAGETSPPVSTPAPAPVPTPAPVTQQTPGKLSDLLAAPSPEQLKPTPTVATVQPPVARTPAVRDPSTILPRLRAIAQEIEEQEAKAKAPLDLTTEVQDSINKVIDNRVLGVLGKEGKGLVVSLQTLQKAPELSRFTPAQLQESAVRLRNSAKVHGHYVGDPDNIVGIASK